MYHDETSIEEPSASESALIASALNLFTIHDESTINVTQLIKAAGVSRSLFYRHFSGKDDVYAGILLRDELSISLKLQELETSRSCGEIMREFLRFRIHQIERYRVILRLEKHLNALDPDLPRYRQWQVLRRRHAQEFKDLIQQSLADKPEHAQDSAHFYYGLIWSLANGVAHLSDTDFFYELLQDRRGFHRFLMESLERVGG
ncbi:TetR/AcrR family transcriptional regulator [Reinekea blandensis]|uniref:Probable transcriptional regulator n=1 Tax=Reinekea blandensis MED297 TaxID=314283 RepID=A4BDY5_9GAMM|nr:TetR/AcrR family transcriptional regulator [Reinekea blandensis]EAR09744.1 probable transcriptional regulator [Reinekea blandensis MED297]